MLLSSNVSFFRSRVSNLASTNLAIETRSSIFCLSLNAFDSNRFDTIIPSFTAHIETILSLSRIKWMWFLFKRTSRGCAVLIAFSFFRVSRSCRRCSVCLDALVGDIIHFLVCVQLASIGKVHPRGPCTLNSIGRSWGDYRCLGQRQRRKLRDRFSQLQVKIDDTFMFISNDVCIVCFRTWARYVTHLAHDSYSRNSDGFVGFQWFFFSHMFVSSTVCIVTRLPDTTNLTHLTVVRLGFVSRGSIIPSLILVISASTVGTERTWSLSCLLIQSGRSKVCNCPTVRSSRMRCRICFVTQVLIFRVTGTWIIERIGNLAWGIEVCILISCCVLSWLRRWVRGNERISIWNDRIVDEID